MLALFLLSFGASFFMTFLSNIDALLLAIWEEN